MLRRDSSSRIERDHQLFAERVSVLLLDEKDFPEYDRAVIYPSGSSAFGESLDDVEILREEIAQNFPALKNFIRWIMSEAWLGVDHTTLLRRIIAEARDVRGELDPRRADHLALIVELGTALPSPFASLTGMVFRRHLQPNEREQLDDAVRVIIWGGRERYDFCNVLRRELAVRKAARRVTRWFYRNGMGFSSCCGAT
jgi:hypothetical protein